MRIDEKVREAHLEHFCPGGLGFPAGTARPAWPGRTTPRAKLVSPGSRRRLRP